MRPSPPPGRPGPGGPAEALQRARERIAEAVTERLYQERPELVGRYGTAGIRKCREDILYNLEYLAPAVELDNPRLFTGYVEWLVPMLAARNVPPGDVHRSLELMIEVVRDTLDEAHATTVVRHLRAGLEAAVPTPRP